MVGLYLLVALLLLLLNAFFVLAEFAAVKMRPTRVETLARAGDARAVLMRGIQTRLDEYLSVCQVGITLASIGLGFVGEPAFARLLEPAFRWTGALSAAVAHGLAISIAYVLVSFLHIVLGELVPKSMAIRGAESAALLSARPLRVFHFIFYVPLVILNGAANLVLRLLGYPSAAREKEHTQEELKIILGGSQSRGLISFRRLLFIENIFDLEGVKVRHAMKARSEVKVLRLHAPWPESERMLRETRLSRYPLVDESSALPLGVVHVKDLYYSAPAAPDLRKLARPFLSVRPDADLEAVLGELQQRRVHLAIVTGPAGDWVGLITLEDVIEEILGTIEDEFETEPPWSVADALSEPRIVLAVAAPSIDDAIRRIIASVPAGQMPADPGRILDLLLDRERVMSTYLGSGLALPHARLDGLQQPVLLFARSEDGVPVRDGQERAHLFFVLLTPTQVPRSQVRLLARIAGMMDSEFVREKLRGAQSQPEVLEAIRQAEAATMR